MNEESDIYGIIIRSFAGNIPAEERALLEEWKAADKANLLEYADYETIWHESGRLASPVPVNLPSAYSKIVKATGPGKPVRLPVWLNVAALVVLSVLFAGLYNLLTRPVPETEETLVAYQEIRASYGTQSKVTLPDGTTVYLNSGSILKYPVSFSGLEERRVELTGESFFEVDKQNGKPFIVEMGRMQVEVTGTRFNADAYPENRNITIALVEGEVMLNHCKAKNNARMTALKPGEIAQLRLDENHLYISEVADMEKYYAWTEGKIQFIDDPIYVVVEKLSNWYNVDIILADHRLDRYRFTGTFIDEPVEQILAILSRTSPLVYTIIPPRKLDDNSFTKRKITLKLK